MQDNQTDLLIDEQIHLNGASRKKLLPIWIKVFMWFFLITGTIMPVVFLIGVFGHNAELSFYGLETNEPFSAIGILITSVFVIKGVTAFGLLKETDWAIKIGIADAIIGITICTISMIYPFINAEFKFALRLELIALIPYLLTFLKIKTEWERVRIK